MPPSARADAPDDVLGQATQDLAQAAQLLVDIPQSSLDADQLGALSGQESLLDNGEGLVTQLDSMQASLPAAGLPVVDQGVLQADPQSSTPPGRSSRPMAIPVRGRSR